MPLLFAAALLASLLAVSTERARGYQEQPLAEPCQEPYDDVSNACVLSSGATTFGFLREPGATNVYLVDVPVAGTRVRADLSQLPADYDMYLLDGDRTLMAQSA